MSRQLFLDAVCARRTSRPVVGSGTSVVTVELMEKTGAYFPEAHWDPVLMSRLAGAGHTILGYDVVMPLFSVWHESAALGCSVDWGDRSHMPSCRTPIWTMVADIRLDRRFLDHPAVRAPLEAIRTLKRDLGDDCAVCGKVFGPWTLGYHGFGVEAFLEKTLSDPEEVRAILDALKHVTLAFAEAQIDAGADCLLVADHATQDLCSPQTYCEFLLPIHRELANRIACPLILHICGNTRDRVAFIARSGMDCFHWDTKSGGPEDIRALAGAGLSLMGGVSNLPTLLRGTPENVRQQSLEAVRAGINIVGPECAVPLEVTVENLRAITDAVRADV